MSAINYDLKKIRAFIFDIDGVLSKQTITLSSNGEPLRTANIHDGYALHLAVKCGYGVAIITGGNSPSVKVRYESLGIKDIYLKSEIKMTDFYDYLKKTGYKPEEIIYVGDDIPDYKVMMNVGLPIASNDAAPEIKAIAKYISPKKGGEGVARDVIEQVLKVHGHWMSDVAFSW
ncbi:MAG TPA: 3-deoxy-D-manno-octulosonate 8-phosphate phosphatase [Porphyromonadaceae bacterium]|jgi:3-deoxy-D-manno-octulosonate 8-phosphate phosphatase (KDO 8-P phosphatase)|nr:3-deoxy-D-manno-octulosonate 8-phosphate phosphatase [Porphyromonadaceae bacterium]